MKTLILILGLIASPALADVLSGQDMGAVTSKKLGRLSYSSSGGGC